MEDASLLLTSLPEAHRRVLIAVGQGRVRYGEIGNEVGARIERPLEALIRTGLIRVAAPIGAPLKARPEYRVDDAYLRFWFRCLSNGVQRIEAGQGSAVLQHTVEEWQGQLGWNFEQAARDPPRVWSARVTSPMTARSMNGGRRAVKHVRLTFSGC